MKNLVYVVSIVFVTSWAWAVEFHAPIPPTPEYQGATLYVSKLGDNSDGSSWSKAFHTIQSALNSVPNDKGGHRIIIRPDTYWEAMLSPAYSGSKKAYNELIGDVDGSLGSGAKGSVVIDSSDLSKGFKSYDWWGVIRATQQGWSSEHKDPTFSAIVWDRWILRNLYATGSDGGLFWDCTNRVEPFTIIVEDCISIGRAFGGGVASCLSRTDEPIVFRRCQLWSLDWWGDTAGAYVRVENPNMPDRPDVYFEDCTMVSPQCALKGGNYGFHTYMRIKVERCRLIALNFSQPQGTPTDGVVQSVQNGKYLCVDFEDSTLMGYKVFGVKVDKDSVDKIQYSAQGAVQAYVQFTQSVPEGFQRLGQWPVNVFQSLLPPSPYEPRSPLQDVRLVRKDRCEISPIVWKDRLCHLESVRPGSGGVKSDYYLLLTDAETGAELTRFAEGYSLACALVHDGVFYAFASRFEDNNWNDVTMFKSSDLKNWESKVVVQQEDEHLFNSSVCAGPTGFVMAYESNDPTYPAFTTKFAVSNDLENWYKKPNAMFGADRYTACPCIRYVNGCYYVLYLEQRAPGHYYFETFITRSKDLIEWERSVANPVLAPIQIDEGINASDPDLVEFQGNTYVYYAVGDQRTWMNVKRGVYNGSLQEFLESWYQTPGVPEPGDLSSRRRQNSKNEDANEEKRQENRRVERIRWFREAKFGMFVHWGLYAVHGKNDKGPYVSWSMHDEEIPNQEYEKYANQFTPQKFDAAQWMDIAKSAGMRYVIFTSKHHEGFSMFDSALTDYDSMDRAAGRDFVRELIEAARADDMKIGFYYSMLDWRRPEFKTDFSQYVNRFMFGQIRELCMHYGPIDCLWFDGEWDYSADVWRAPELVNMIRELQPNALINDRLGKGERGKTPLCDFYTREQMSEINHSTEFEKRRNIPWEACLTIGTSWGYKRNDAPLKSSAELIRALVDIVSRGGNLLLNVGPTPEGEIPEALTSRLQDIGAWLAVNGESIYGTEVSPVQAFPTGRCTQKGSRLYVHLESHPGQALQLINLHQEIKRVWILKTGDELAFDDKNNTISIPDSLGDDAIVTIGIELESS
ncbi:MAG: alpha-L-fucosidase [Candidatus Omnitrophica bacterium]|nr:alpha-L-fucosidase [Candidatus Omnitrophota bacterium]